MGFYTRYILPRLVIFSLGSQEVKDSRRVALAGCAGSVLEVGFGNGLNLPHYGGLVTSLVGIDPSPLAEKLSRRERATANFQIEVHTGSGEELPFEENRFDSVAMTFSLCTIPQPEKALTEIQRVLRPGGKLYFLEHGLSDDHWVARWQKRLNGLHGLISGGCHLDRDHRALITASGMKLEQLENYYMKGPRPMTYIYRGIALNTEGMA